MEDLKFIEINISGDWKIDPKCSINAFYTEHFVEKATGICKKRQTPIMTAVKYTKKKTTSKRKTKKVFKE